MGKKIGEIRGDRISDDLDGHGLHGRDAGKVNFTRHDGNPSRYTSILSSTGYTRENSYNTALVRTRPSLVFVPLILSTSFAAVRLHLTGQRRGWVKFREKSILQILFETARGSE